MIDFIYTILIAPLEYWMREVLLWAHGHCGNWGEAIIAMSLVVNFVILPIYMKAESWQEQEQKIRLGFEQKERMIKKAFRGQERFAMISTMRRQAGYTAFLSMRSSVGFFLQIPFFFAAYHFLSHFDPLAGVSFMGLTDLSRPDELFHLFGLPINFMPILMTVINIASALIYTQNLTRRDKIQLYAMAALFLVLLYDAASGLVLYWTCNNIFSLGKNIAYDQCRKHLGWVKNVNWQIRFEPVAVGERKKGAFVFGLWLLGLLFSALSSNQTTLVSGGFGVFCTHASNVLYGISALGVFYAIVKLELWKTHKTLTLFLTILALWTLRMVYRYEFVTVPRYGAYQSIAFVSMVAPLIVSSIWTRLHEYLYEKHSPSSLYTPAATWLVILLTIYLPLQVYNTSPESFSAPSDVMAQLLVPMAVLIVLFWVLQKLSYLLSVEKMAAVAVSYLATMMTVYAFVLALDAGALDGFQFGKPENLYRAVNLVTDLIAIPLVTLLFVYILRRGWIKAMRAVFVICSCVGLAAVCVGLRGTQAQWMDQNDTQVVKLPEWNDRFLGFSQNKDNILVIVLDMFTGYLADPIFNSDPQLKTAYKDFTWYPDTLASGTITRYSFSTILGGRDCLLEAMNAQPNRSIVEKANEAYAKTLNALAEDRDFCLCERNNLQSTALSRYAQFSALTLGDLGVSYQNRYAKQMNIATQRPSDALYLMCLSAYTTMPWSIRNHLYNSGLWLGNIMAGVQSRESQYKLKEWAFMETFPENANANAKQNTFKMLHMDLTHRPWLMDENCKIVKKALPENANEWTNAGQVNVAHCALRSLSRWIEWMKANRVYDNTSIFIVSDHGFGTHGKPNALLLTKKAKAAHPQLVVDTTPMMLSDIPDLLLGRFESSEARHRTRSIYSANGQKANTYPDVKKKTVTGPLLKNGLWSRDFTFD